MRTIGIILKKELKRYFTDVRMLIGIILPGILIFLLYSVMGNFMGQQSSSIKECTIYVVNEPVELAPIFQMEDIKITKYDQTLEENEILKR